MTNNPTLDIRLCEAIEHLRWHLHEGFTYSAVNSFTAQITQVDGTLGLVKLDPSTGYCEFWPRPSAKGNGYSHRFGKYTPSTGWRLLPVFLKPEQHRLDPGNYDNIYSW